MNFRLIGKGLSIHTYWKAHSSALRAILKGLHRWVEFLTEATQKIVLPIPLLNL